MTKNPKPTDQAPELKPREFVIVETQDKTYQAFLKCPSNSNLYKGIHVIEYTAIHQLETQLAGVEAEAQSRIRANANIRRDFLAKLDAIETQHATLVDGAKGLFDCLELVQEMIAVSKRKGYLDEDYALGLIRAEKKTFNAKVGKSS